MLRKLIIITLVVLLGFGAIAGYRAWVQVKRLDLLVAGVVLGAGSTARVSVVTSGRVPVDVRLVLVQGTRAETLAVQRVYTHRDPLWDTRSIASTMPVMISAEALTQFTPGPAVLRASATGRPQWLLEPAPLVREMAVEVASPTPPPAPTAAPGKRR